MNIENRLAKLEKEEQGEPPFKIRLTIHGRHGAPSSEGIITLGGGGTGPESAEIEKAGTQFSK